MRRWFGRWIGVMAVVGSLTAYVPVARADDGLWRAFQGKLVFSDIALAPASFFENSAQMSSALRRIQRTTIDQGAGFWRIHLMAFLAKPAATGTLVLRATDVSDPRVPQLVRVFEIPVNRGDKELRLDDFVVTQTMGFAPGASYEFVLEAPADEGGAGAETRKAGKADAYAKGVITLR
ncbi:MAG TPA: hypothetical protein VN903_05930 [Polyangia bacterium]|nr:hypothetical protein [Polyangia bacterium]